MLIQLPWTSKPFPLHKSTPVPGPRSSHMGPDQGTRVEWLELANTRRESLNNLWHRNLQLALNSLGQVSNCHFVRLRVISRYVKNLRCYSHIGHTQKKLQTRKSHGIQLDSYWIYGPNFETSKWNINETRRRPFNARASVFEADRPTQTARFRASVALHGPTELELHFACGLKNIPATVANKVWKYDRYWNVFRLHENWVFVCFF